MLLWEIFNGIVWLVSWGVKNFSDVFNKLIMSNFRPSEVEKFSHPVICKKIAPRSPEVSSKSTSKPSYPLETTRTPGQSIARPMWIVSDYIVLRLDTESDYPNQPRRGKSFSVCNVFHIRAIEYKSSM